MDVTALPQQAPEAGFGLHPVLSITRHIDELPSYVVPDTDLEMGASLGNSSCWVTTKGTGDIESVFSTFLGEKVTWSHLCTLQWHWAPPATSVSRRRLADANLMSARTQDEANPTLQPDARPI